MRFNGNKGLIVACALIWPLVCWGGIVGYKAYQRCVGASITLPISGYDPRDLLSGHYLVYQVDYGASCRDLDSSQRVKAGCVINPGGAGARISVYPPGDDSLYIKGHCQYGNFVAGIERFYVPEDAAPRLDAILRGRQMPASIVLSVSADGGAQVKDFLLNGKPWAEALKELDKDE